MNKAELVAAIQERLAQRNDLDISRALIQEILDETFDIIAEEVEQDRHIHLAGFGRFWLGKSAARTVQNPRTGEPMQVKEKRIIKLRSYRDSAQEP
jgi:nucleoid DNA-binding protein